MRETKLWTWFMLAGVVLFLLLGLHMVITHAGELTGVFVAHPGEEAVSKANSQARDANPLFPYFFVVMLAAGLFHGLYGLRTILFELGLRRGVEKAISVLLLVLGLGLFGLGTYAAFKAHGNALKAPAPSGELASVGRG
jgi:succinate dehydrogenase / fumarate reductase membrane anchor subunit